MIDIYFLSPSSTKYIEELRKGRKILGALDLNFHTAYAIESTTYHGHFYLDADRYVIGRAIRENYSDALVKLERAMMEKLVPHFNTGDLIFQHGAMEFMVLTSPQSEQPILFLESRMISPEFYHTQF